MKTKLFFLGVFVLLLLLMIVILAQAVGYQIPWWNVDAGGGVSRGGSYSIADALGQPDTGPQLSGSGYRLTGDFLAGEISVSTGSKGYRSQVFNKP